MGPSLVRGRESSQLKGESTMRSTCPDCCSAAERAKCAKSCREHAQQARAPSRLLADDAVMGPRHEEGPSCLGFGACRLPLAPFVLAQLRHKGSLHELHYG